MLIYVIIIIILFIILIFVLNNKNNKNQSNIKKYIEITDNENFFIEINEYFNKIKEFSTLLKLKFNEELIIENNEFNKKMKIYIKKYSTIHENLKNEIMENIKDNKYYQKHKQIILDMFQYLYAFNLKFDNNNIFEYYEIFMEKLKKDLNCCATIWNINLFFNKLIKNFNYKN